MRERSVKREMKRARAYPDIGLVSGIRLPLVVEDGRGRDGVPFARIGQRISGRVEVIGPFPTEAGVGWRLEG